MANRTNRTGKTPKSGRSSAPTPPAKPKGRKAITRAGKWKAVFLGMLAECGNVTTARKGAGIAKETLWAHKAKDKAFAQAWGEALDESVDALKAEAWRRAKEGTDIPVTHEGQLCFVAVGPEGNYVPEMEAFEHDPQTRKPFLKPGYKLVPFVKKQYSDALLMLLLKSGRPSEFGDKMQLSRGEAEVEPIVLVHSAPPPQPVKEGRAGTAKTTGICIKILHNCRKYPGSRHLICRETRTRLTESVMVTFEKLVGVTHPEVMRVKRLQRHSHNLWGSEVVWGGLDEPERLFSTEWDTVYVNEANEIGLEAWELFGRAMRNGKMPYQQRVADVNPTFPGHWLNKRAFPCSDALRHLVTREDYNRLQIYNNGPQPGPMRRLVSVHQDNPGYWEMNAWDWTPQGREYVMHQLATMSGHLRQRMFEGLWRAGIGTVYPEFAAERHIIAPFPGGVPQDWPIHAGWDPGFDHPTAILFIAVAPNGCLYVIDEIYEGGKAVSDHCATIRTRNAGRTVRRYYGDPQHAFSKTAQSPQSIAAQAKKCGITLSPWPRSTDVEAMVNAVREKLKADMLKVFSTCTNTIDEFQAWRYKRTAKGEPPSGDDAFEDANNHAMDVIKGLVALGLEKAGKGTRSEYRDWPIPTRRRGGE